MKKTIHSLLLVGTLALTSNAVLAGCNSLPDYTTLSSALSTAQKEANGGFSLNMWATIVDRDGIVCAVTMTAPNRGGQWPGSRVISAQKANTANAFSLAHLALSTANLYSATQPGGSLFGLQESNPVNVVAAYQGPSKNYGTASDPLIGQKIGGVNVFGGGLALYDANGSLLGGIGVSGDSSCADHNVAWKTRKLLNLDHVYKGVNPTHSDDNIVYDITGSTSASGWGHPVCSQAAKDIADNFPKAGS